MQIQKLFFINVIHSILNLVKLPIEELRVLHQTPIQYQLGNLAMKTIHTEQTGAAWVLLKGYSMCTTEFAPVNFAQEYIVRREKLRMSLMNSLQTVMKTQVCWWRERYVLIFFRYFPENRYNFNLREDDCFWANSPGNHALFREDPQNPIGPVNNGRVRAESCKKQVVLSW